MNENTNLNRKENSGVPINLISKESLYNLSSNERVNFVLNEVKNGKVLVLETGLSSTEEAALIEKTMQQIDHETFIGIEIQSYARSGNETGNWLDRLLKRIKPPRMAVIGPANLIKTIHKDGNIIETMLVTKEQVIEESEETKKISGKNSNLFSRGGMDYNMEENAVPADGEGEETYSHGGD